MKKKTTDSKLVVFPILPSLLAAFGSFLLLVLHSHFAFAQEPDSLPLVVAPARQQLQIDPGKSESASIKFFNFSTEPVKGNIKAVDFIVTNTSGAPKLLENEDIKTRFSAADWISLPYESATIPAEDKITVQFKITAPSDAAPGGRYAAIFFEPTGSVPAKITESESFAATIPRIVGLIYLRVNGPITEAALIKAFTLKSFVEYGPVDVTTEILNKGDYHITPKGQVTLTNWFGKKVGEQELATRNIFPDSSRIYENKLGGKWLLGRYKVDLLALYGDTGQVLARSAYFWAFPVRIVLVIILTITLLVLLTILVWKKLKGKQSKLEQKLEEEISEIETLKNKYMDSPSPAPPTTKLDKKK